MNALPVPVSFELPSKKIGNFADIVSDLESDEFYSEAAVASSPYSLLRRIASHAVTIRLVEFLESDPEENVPTVLKYSNQILESASGNVRSDNDVALCACVVALSRTSRAGVEDLFRRVRNTRELALKWPSELAYLIMSKVRLGSLRTTNEVRFGKLPQAVIQPVDTGLTEEAGRKPLAYNLSTEH